MNRDLPLVSVIIATRNRPQLLRRAIQSVADQTYPKIEIVVVDENDPNGEARRQTARTIMNLSSSRPILYLSDRAPTMVCTARNEGAAQASGELLAFLDDDDYWKETKLATQVHCLQQSELGPALVYTGLEVVDSSGNTLKIRRPRHRGAILTDLLKVNVIGTPSSVIMRREVFNAIGGFDPALPTRHDFDLYVRVAEHHSIDFIPEPLTAYLNLQLSAMSKDYEKKLEGRRLVLEKHYGLYEKRPELLSAYYYGSALLSMKHGDRKTALQFLRESLKAKMTVRATIRWTFTFLHFTKPQRKLEKPATE